MNGIKKLHDEQDAFIKKTLQEDKIIHQPMFDAYEQKMNQTKLKVKKYSYKQQKIIVILLLLLAISVGFNIYQAFVKEAPITITNIFQPVENKVSEKNDDNLPTENKVQETPQTSETIVNTSNSNTVDNVITNTTTTVEIQKPVEPPAPKEPINTNLTPQLFTDINTNEVEDFVEQFAIGINKFDLNNTSDLESNTILLYIAQQYFSAKSNSSNSLTVDTTYASSAENFHKFLSEFTINDYSTIGNLKSYNNYIGYVSRSKSYVYGKDFETISKEKYSCEDVSITNKEDTTYTAKAKVTRNYEGETSTYEVTFTFKVNGNYKYQKYKLLSLQSKITSGSLDNVIHLVGK